MYIDYYHNKSQIKNWEDFIRVLSHEGQHAEVVPEIARTDLEKEANSNLGKESEYKSPATIKYGIQSSIGGITLGSGYEELEKRGILDSWKLDKQQKIEVKDVLDYADNYFEFLKQLEILTGKKVDLVSKKSLKNPILIEEIERSKVELYAA